jgi:hypothetical protein
MKNRKVGNSLLHTAVERGVTFCDTADLNFYSTAILTPSLVRQGIPKMNSGPSRFYWRQPTSPRNQSLPRSLRNESTEVVFEKRRFEDVALSISVFTIGEEEIVSY